jgi:hypothetical protein
MPKYYELYNFFSNKFGEDISMKILRITGVIPVRFFRHHFSFNIMRNAWNYFNMEYNVWDYFYDKKITSVFLKINNYNKGIIQQKTFRNYIFRNNIKVYYLHEIITNKGTKDNYIPIGRFFEQRPVFPIKVCKILLCEIKYHNDNLYIIIDYVDKIPKDGMKIISKLRR